MDSFKNKNDFIGKRALERNSMNDNSRKQLVGLVTINPNIVIPEGAHAILDKNQELPYDMLGHVTSSYYSPNLGKSIALALLKNGTYLHGKTVWLPQINGNDPIEAKVTKSTFM